MLPGLQDSPEFRVDLENHEYWLGRIRLDSVTDAIEGIGLANFPNREEMVKARIRGTAVHQATRYWDEGTLEESSLEPFEKFLGEPLEPYLEAWKKFRRQTGFKPCLQEYSAYSQLWQFAGTIDVIGFMPDGRQFLIDKKTGSLPPWGDLQTGGYELLVPERRPIHRAAVLLTESGRFGLRIYDNPTDGQVFLAVLTAFKYGRERGIYKTNR